MLANRKPLTLTVALVATITLLLTGMWPNPLPGAAVTAQAAPAGEPASDPASGPVSGPASSVPVFILAEAPADAGKDGAAGTTGGLAAGPSAAPVEGPAAGSDSAQGAEPALDPANRPVEEADPGLTNDPTDASNTAPAPTNDSTAPSDSAPANGTDAGLPGADEPADKPGLRPGEEVLLLRRDSSLLVHNGVEYRMPRPVTVIKGVTYVPARAFAERLRIAISWEAKTKTYIFKHGETQIRLTPGKAAYTVNGVKIQGSPALVEKGTLMVPVRLFVQHFGFTMTADPKGREIRLSRMVLPVAAFALTTDHVHAGETTVGYVDQASHPLGLRIVAERWEGRQERFDQPGTYVVTRWVQDETGAWSEPYAVTVEVLPPNEPPRAFFTTDKISYKMGEWIEYRDYSTDDENRIVKTEWIGAENGFFEPGEKTVTLRVTDEHGLTSEYTRTIVITDELLYTKEQFPVVYGKPGDKYTFSGASVPSLPQIPYTIQDFEQMLIRSNSPESIVQDGIYYTDEVAGSIRFMLHHHNRTLERKRIYLVATNPNDAPANVYIDRVGIGGPHPFVTTSGKVSVGRYLESRLVYSPPRRTELQPGESRIIIGELSASPLRPEEAITLFADVRTDAAIRFSVVVVGAEDDVLARLPELPVLAGDGRHVRGTFAQANRFIVANQTIGGVAARLVLADKVTDTWLNGIDMITGDMVSNAGNYGVLYTLKLNRVLPHTGIVLNPRGGHYAGAFAVNGKVVYTTSGSILRDPNEAAILYKTGDQTESVEIIFTPAPGSNLPINLLFIPLAPATASPAGGEGTVPGPGVAPGATEVPGV